MKITIEGLEKGLKYEKTSSEIVEFEGLVALVSVTIK